MGEKQKLCFLCFSFIFSPFIAMMIAIITSGEEERLDIDRRSERKPLEGGGGRAIYCLVVFSMITLRSS